MWEEILQAVEQKGFQYEREYWDCAQCTLLAVQEVFGLKADDAVKAATGFAGGIGRRGSVCGALSGGVMALGLLFGRDLPTMRHPDPELRHKLRENIELRLVPLIDAFCEKFQTEYGTILCNEIEYKIFGRYFDKRNPEDRREKNRLGGHTEKCPMVVGKAARWVTELILAEQAK